MTRTLLLAALCLFLAKHDGHASLDLTIRDCGLSVGNSPRLTGLRINAVDDEVVAVNGINLTLWNPGKNPAAAHRGLSLGLIGPKASTIDGLAVGGLGTVAHDRLLGIGAASFGVGTDRLWGAGAGLFLVEARKSLVGVGLAGYRLQAPEQVWGVAASSWHTRVGNATGVVFGGGMAEVERMRGIQMGAITTARSLNGLAIGGVFAETWDDPSDRKSDTGLPVDPVSRGIVAGGLGAIADTLTGAVVGGLFAFSDDLTGVAVSPLIAATPHRLRGLAFGLGGAVMGDISRGIGVGGLGVGAGKDLVGAALSAGFVGSQGRVRGLLVGGVGCFVKERLDGVAVSLGGVGSKGHLRGIVLSGLMTAAEDSITGVATGLGMVWAGDRIHGLALGGVTCLAREVVGVSTGVFNGAIVQEVNLEEFLVINKANDRHTGLAIGLVNYTRNLHGVQLGLINWAGNNPPWLRLLPLINVHI